MFITTVSSIFSLVIIIAIGFLVTKLGIITKDSQKAISDLVFKVTLPITLIISLQIEYDPSILKNAIFSIFFGFVIQSLMLAISYGVFKVCHIDKSKINIYTYGTAFANIAFMGFPVSSAILGNEAIVYGTMLSVPYNVMGISLAIKLFSNSNESNSGESKFQIKDFLSIPVIACFVSLALFAFKIELPETVQYSFTLIGSITSPMFLILTGSIIAFNDINLSYFSPGILLVAVLKLLVMPALVYILLIPIPIDQYAKNSLVILLGMPAGTYVAVLANKYGGDSYTGSKIFATTTLLSIISIPIIATLFVK